MIGARWFLKILRKVEGGQLKYLFFLTRVGRWSENGQNLPYVISEQSLKMAQNGLIWLNTAQDSSKWLKFA